MANGGGSDNGFFDLVKRISGWVGAATGFITGLVGFAKLFAGDSGLPFYVALAGGGLLLWGSCFYIYYAKRRPRMTAGLVATVPLSVPAFPRWAQRAALFGIFAVPSAYLLGGAVWAYFRLRPPDKFIVVVADFKSLDQQVSGTYERIYSQLWDATRKYSSEIKLVPLGRTITLQEGGNDAALEVGRDNKAGIVIWGWNNKDSITAYFLVQAQSRSYLSQLGGSQTLNLVIAGQEAFKVQVGLSDDIAFLTLLTVGIARYEAQDFDEAVGLLKDALSHAGAAPPQSAADKQLNLAVGYFFLGRAFFDKGDYNQAVANYLESVKVKPDYAVAHLHLGYAYMLSGNSKAAREEFKAAAALYDKVIADSPKDAEAYINRGATYGSLGDYDRALADYGKALELKGEDARIYNNRGLVHYQKGELPLAVQDYTRAISVGAENAAAYNNRGAAYSRMGEFDKALADYSQVLRYRPGNSVSYLNRAFVYYDKHDYERAVADYDRSIELEPNNFRAYRNRGFAHLFLGHYQEAAADAEQALSRMKQCNEAFLYVVVLGYVGHRLGQRPAEAAAVLNRVAPDCQRDWPYPVYQYLRHEIGAEQLAAAAAQIPADEPEPEAALKGRLTEFHTYVGLELLLAGQREAAASHFQWVMENGLRDWDEYPLVLSVAKRNKLAPGG